MNDIERLRVLLNQFNKNLIITDEQLRIVFDFIFNETFYPIKEKLAVRKSVVETIIYLKDMARREGYDTLDKLEKYYEGQREKVDKMLNDIMEKQQLVVDLQEKVIPYNVGMLSASVCADNSLSPEEVEAEFNRISPSGTTHGWKLSEESHFRQGNTNPCQCNQFPESRTHYLFVC